LTIEIYECRQGKLEEIGEKYCKEHGFEQAEDFFEAVKRLNKNKMPYEIYAHCLRLL
jgi:hypothetical protein